MGVGNWYKYSAVTSETLVVEFSNATFDYSYGVSSSADCITFNSVKCTTQESDGDRGYAFNAIAGTDYYILIGDGNSNGNDTGTFDMSLSCAPTPANNLCSTATELSCGSILIGETSDGGVDNGNVTGCFPGVGVWYSYTGPNNGDATVTISPESTYRPKISVSTSYCSYLTNILCETTSMGVPKTITFPMDNGKTYYIFIGDTDNVGISTGDFDIEFQCQSNNVCSNATDLSCGSSLNNESTVGSTAIDPATGCSMGAGTWFRYSALTSETVVLEIEDATFDYSFGVSSSVDCITFNAVKCTSQESDGDRAFAFTAIAGLDYYIFVGDGDSGGNDSGSFDISISCAPTPVNNLCSTATILFCGSLLVGETSDGGIDNGDMPGCFPGVGVWYSYTATRDDIATLIFDSDTQVWKISVSTSTDCLSFTNIICEKTNTGVPLPRTLSFPITYGQTYYIYIGDQSNVGVNTGNFDIELECCADDYIGANTLTGIQAVSMDFETDGTLHSEQLLNVNGTQVHYDSAIMIELLKNFSVEKGTVFEAYIDGCGGSR